jgi:phosphatidylglycerophosphate synthase
MRPRELQDGLNHYLYHPLAWRLALLLAKTPLTPNIVSVIGAMNVVGAAFVYGWGFAHGWGWKGAALGMALHMAWHVWDGADGDLARITGRASPIGEMVDGICDYASHVVMYFVLGWIAYEQISAWTGSSLIGLIAWPLMLAAGVSHVIQANHVEVQKRSYQWWVYAKPWIRQTREKADASTKEAPRARWCRSICMSAANSRATRRRSTRPSMKRRAIRPVWRRSHRRPQGSACPAGYPEGAGPQPACGAAGLFHVGGQPDLVFPVAGHRPQSDAQGLDQHA